MAQMKGMDICDIVVGPCHQSGSKLAVTKPLQLRLETPSGAPGVAARARADASRINYSTFHDAFSIFLCIKASVLLTMTQSGHHLVHLA